MVQNKDISILLVDDEVRLVEALKPYLTSFGYNVLEAYSGKDALDVFEKEKPSLILLDLMLPDMSGEEVCMAIRKISRVPIIMLTAKVEEEDILKGLDIGADDYITKPFSPRRLVARIQALLRRSANEIGFTGDKLSFNDGDLVIDKQKHEVWKNGELIYLTSNEYKIVITMAKHPRKVFTRDELIKLAMGEGYDGYDRGVDSHIKNIRRKLETDTKSPQYILTVHGVGYKFGGE